MTITTSPSSTVDVRTTINRAARRNGIQPAAIMPSLYAQHQPGFIIDHHAPNRRGEPTAATCPTCQAHRAAMTAEYTRGHLDAQRIATDATLADAEDMQGEAVKLWEICQTEPALSYYGGLWSGFNSACIMLRREGKTRI